MKLKRLQKYIICLITLIAIAVLFSCCSAHNKSSVNIGNTITQKVEADFVTQPDIVSLINNSKIIISGKVLSVDPSVKVPVKFDFPDRVTEAEREKIENSEEGSYMFTVSEVEVSKIIKGDLNEGDIVKIYQMGGSSKEKTTIVDGMDYLKQGEDHILFITDWDGKYTIVDYIQGDIRLIDEKSKVNKDNKLFHDGIEEDKIINNIKAEVDKAQNAHN